MNKFDTSKNGLLVAIDFSPYSQFALEFAAKQADCQDVNLSVLHVVHDPGEMPGYYAKLLKKKQLVNIEDMAEELLTEFIQKVREANPGIHSLETLSTILVVGLPVTRILEVVEKINPTQLFMGSQGRTGLKHLMLGSKAEQVLRLCPIPVTIVKNTTVAP